MVAIESSGYVQAELHGVVIKEHVLLMIYIQREALLRQHSIKNLTQAVIASRISQ